MWEFFLLQGVIAIPPFPTFPCCFKWEHTAERIPMWRSSLDVKQICENFFWINILWISLHTLLTISVNVLKTKIALFHIQWVGGACTRMCHFHIIVGHFGNKFKATYEIYWESQGRCGNKYFSSLKFVINKLRKAGLAGRKYASVKLLENWF